MKNSACTKPAYSVNRTMNIPLLIDADANDTQNNNEERSRNSERERDQTCAKNTAMVSIVSPLSGGTGKEASSRVGAAGTEE